MKKNIFKLFILCCICMLFSSQSANAAVSNNEVTIGNEGEYGKIYGTERNPEAGDLSKWLTIQSGENGVRITSKDGVEYFAIDNYGGIYVNGDLYIKGKMYEEPKILGNTANGFMYLLIVLSLCMNMFLIVKNRKRNN